MMRRTVWWEMWKVALGLLGLAVAEDAGAGPVVDFNRDIRPILSENCYQCHGPDANKRKADLRLDTREGLFRSRDGVKNLVARKPDQSDIFDRISAEDDEIRMPP